MRTLTREWSRYLSAAREVMDAAGKENDVTKASNLLVNKTSPIAQIIDEVLKKDVASNQTGANVATQDAEEAYALAFKLIVSIFALSILLAAAAGFYLVRDIMQGITSIITPMRALANGDLTAVIPHQGNKTEIGAIADTLQMFKEALVAKKITDDSSIGRRQCQDRPGPTGRQHHTRIRGDNQRTHRLLVVIFD